MSYCPLQKFSFPNFSLLSCKILTSNFLCRLTRYWQQIWGMKWYWHNTENISLLYPFIYSFWSYDSLKIVGTGRGHVLLQQYLQYACFLCKMKVVIHVPRKRALCQQIIVSGVLVLCAGSGALWKAWVEILTNTEIELMGLTQLVCLKIRITVTCQGVMLSMYHSLYMYPLRKHWGQINVRVQSFFKFQTFSQFGMNNHYWLIYCYFLLISDIKQLHREDEWTTKIHCSGAEQRAF